jgi:hypothetical protein
MALKIEYIIVLFIVLTILFSLSFNTEKEKEVTAGVATKDLQFQDTIFREVDKNSTISSAFAVQGIQIDNTLKLKNIKFSNSDIKYIVGNAGTYKGDIITLKGNVKMLATNGFYCETQSASYDKNKKILDILKPFSAHMDKNRLLGDTLRYLFDEKMISVENPQATIFTTE